MEQLFNCAHKYNTLFPMPIWEVLDGVEKSEVRNTLNRLINNENEKYNDERVRTGKPRIVRINSTEEFLDIILTSFEMSEYKTLLDYFVAEEYRWLQDYQLQADYDHMGEDLNLRKLGDFVKLPRVMNEHTFGYVKEEEIVLDDDNAGGLGNTKTIVNFPHQTADPMAPDRSRCRPTGGNVVCDAGRASPL